MQVFILTVFDKDEFDGDDGYLVLHTAHSNEARARTALADWCRDTWLERNGIDESKPFDEGDDGTNNPLPDDDELAVEIFFDFWTPENTYNIDELTVDADINQEAT